MTTQKQRILEALRLEPRCGTTFLDWHIPRYAARIYELRTEGHNIVSTPCKLHHHDSAQIVYRLVEMSQMELAL